MADAIAVCGLRKSYGKTVALDRLDLSVATGEVHGFLGPNGSGKTTTIRILLGLLRADGGSARLLGGDPWSEATSLHPQARLRARRRHALAGPVRRRGDRPARAAARRAERPAQSQPARSFRPGPDEEGTL